MRVFIEVMLVVASVFIGYNIGDQGFCYSCWKSHKDKEDMKQL